MVDKNNMAADGNKIICHRKAGESCYKMVQRECHSQDGLRIYVNSRQVLYEEEEDQTEINKECYRRKELKEEDRKTENRKRQTLMGNEGQQIAAATIN